MTGAASTSRYGADDLETASIRSAAPSYGKCPGPWHGVFDGTRANWYAVSEVPSYHSTTQYLDAAPPYAPIANVSPASPALPESSPARDQTSTPRPQTIGLPPIPPLNPQSVVTLNSFRIPTWSANNAPAARHYRNVAERRMTDGRYSATDLSKRHSAMEPPLVIHSGNMPHLRPLEDPYLVGEVAARQARRERTTRESGEDILVQEDRQWDWLLAHMKDSEERHRSGTRYRREPDIGPRKKLLHRLGGRLLS